jgi:hypothetical protein
MASCYRLALNLKAADHRIIHPVAEKVWMALSSAPQHRLFFIPWYHTDIGNKSSRTYATSAKHLPSTTSQLRVSFHLYGTWANISSVHFQCLEAPLYPKLGFHNSTIKKYQNRLKMPLHRRPQLTMGITSDIEISSNSLMVFIESMLAPLAARYTFVYGAGFNPWIYLLVMKYAI